MIVNKEKKGKSIRCRFRIYKILIRDSQTKKTKLQKKLLSAGRQFYNLLLLKERKKKGQESVGKSEVFKLK